MCFDLYFRLDMVHLPLQCLVHPLPPIPVPLLAYLPQLLPLLPLWGTCTVFPLHLCRPLVCPHKDFPLLQFPLLDLDHHPLHLVDFRDLPLQEWDLVALQEEGVLVDFQEDTEDGESTFLLYLKHTCTGNQL